MKVKKCPIGGSLSFCRVVCSPDKLSQNEMPIRFRSAWQASTPAFFLQKELMGSKQRGRRDNSN